MWFSCSIVLTEILKWPAESSRLSFIGVVLELEMLPPSPSSEPDSF